MRFSLRGAGLSTALAVVGVLACAGASAADLQITGDQAAWQELHAAFDKLLALPSFKMRYQGTTSQGNATWTWEVMPDRSHAKLVLDSGNGEEDVTVGGQSRHRFMAAGGGEGPWNCGPGPLTMDPAAFADFSHGFQGTLIMSRGPATLIDNVPMSAYVAAAASTNNAVLTKTTVYVASTTGLPRRSQSIGSTRGETGQSTTDFYDFNVPVTISLPPCQ